MNSFYYRYFLARKGFVFEVPDEEWDDSTLDLLAKNSEQVKSIADSLGISSLWLTDMPVIFSKRAFNYYIGSKSLSGMIIPEEEGLALVNPSSKLKEGLRAIELSAIGFEPMPTSLVPRPYSMLFLAAEKNEMTLDGYLRSKLGLTGEAFADLYKELLMCNAFPPVGSPLICQRDIIEKISEAENLTYDECASTFYVADSACLFNLFLAFRLFVEPWHITPRRDGKYLIAYRGYDYADFLSIGAKAAQSKSETAGRRPMAKRRVGSGDAGR